MSKLIKYEIRFARGQLGFDPTIEKAELPIRNMSDKTPLVVVLYRAEYQSTYSRDYYRIVILARVRDVKDENTVEQYVKNLLTIDRETNLHWFEGAGPDEIIDHFMHLTGVLSESDRFTAKIDVEYDSESHMYIKYIAHG